MLGGADLQPAEKRSSESCRVSVKVCADGDVVVVPRSDVVVEVVSVVRWQCGAQVVWSCMLHS